MASYMEMIYIDSDDLAQKTGVSAQFETNALTRANFLSLKSKAVPFETAQFLCDYYDRKGDLIDTIALPAASYAEITGEPVLTDAEYREIDKQYWQKAGEKTS